MVPPSLQLSARLGPLPCPSTVASLLSLSSGMLFRLCLHCSREASFMCSVHFKKKLSLIPHHAPEVLGRAERSAPGRGQSGMVLYFLAPGSTCHRLCQCPQDLEVFWILFPWLLSWSRSDWCSLVPCLHGEVSQGSPSGGCRWCQNYNQIGAPNNSCLPSTVNLQCILQS